MSFSILPKTLPVSSQYIFAEIDFQNKKIVLYTYDDSKINKIVTKSYIFPISNCWVFDITK